MNQETLNYIQKEVMKYIGCFNTDKVLYAYNRMTVEELAQEVALKILRSTEEANKSYIRKAVMFTCIDEYRKTTEGDPVDIEETIDDDKELVERLRTLEVFDSTEIDIVLLLLEGYRNSEILVKLDLPKRTYYNKLSRIKRKYTDIQGSLRDL